MTDGDPAFTARGSSPYARFSYCCAAREKANPRTWPRGLPTVRIRIMRSERDVAEHSAGRGRGPPSSVMARNRAAAPNLAAASSHSAVASPVAEPNLELGIRCSSQDPIRGDSSRPVIAGSRVAATSPAAASSHSAVASPVAEPNLEPGIRCSSQDPIRGDTSRTGYPDSSPPGRLLVRLALRARLLKRPEEVRTCLLPPHRPR